MKKLLLLFVLAVNVVAGQDQLQRVTIGFGAGYSNLPRPPQSYALSTDTLNALKLQRLSKDNFVISSVISIRLFEATTPSGSKQLTAFQAGQFADHWYEPISINVAINLVEANSQNVSFNKSIDGGIGVGYYLNSFAQVSFFMDIIRARQLRDHVVKDYEGKSIPKGKDRYTAIDESDNNLFYTKNFVGFSIKAIFTVGNKTP
jgi:hypothetical protein